MLNYERIDWLSLSEISSYTKKNSEALADFLSNFDIIVIQELVSPPIDGTFPQSSETYTATPKAAEFHTAMLSERFDFVLSEEDTGPTDRIHINSAESEWWITYFLPNKVKIANDLPGGFLASDRSANINYDRVPYAFPFRSQNDSIDFVLISVHLDSEADSNESRKDELAAIESWIQDHSQAEKDFIILGDMNFQSANEYLENIHCTGQKITTNFKRKGRAGKHEDHRQIIATELRRERATRMEGSFGTEKQHYSLDKIKARTKQNEILWIFMGVHTANAVRIAKRLAQEKSAQTAA